MRHASTRGRLFMRLMQPMQRMRRSVGPALLCALLLIGLPPRAAAQQQSLQGRWVTDTQQRIDRLRKTEVRVVVLDARGEPVRDATVRIDQQRHAFPLGFTLTEAQWPAGIATQQPVWRCFNAVSLDPLTDWARVAPDADATPDFEAARRMVDQAKRAGMRVRFGGVISGDLGRNPAWVGERRPAELPELLHARLARALRDVNGAVTHYDLYTNALDHDFIENLLGTAVLRGLFERAGALAPDASIGMRFEDCLLGARLRRMVRRVIAMDRDFIPIDVVALEHRVTGHLVQARLARALDWLGRLQMDVVLVGLELGGNGPASAAFNAEVMLRTAFASPNVKGIWLGPVHGDETGAPNAALFDEAGVPTKVGQVVDRLFNNTWRTDKSAQTDARGNVQTTVFAGVHEIEAKLPEGPTVSMTVHVPMRDEARMIVLEPSKIAQTQPASDDEAGAEDDDNDGDENDDEGQMDL